MATLTKEIQQLSDTLRGVEVLMLASVAVNGHLSSRPLVLQEVDADGTMWFFIGRSSGLADDLRGNPQVVVSYAYALDTNYIAVSGKATLVEDRARTSALWRAEYLTWFPLGITDPELALIRIDVLSAEHWLDGAHLHLAVPR